MRLHGIAAPVDGAAIFVYGIAPSTRDGADFLVNLTPVGVQLNGPAPKLFQLVVPVTNMQTPSCRVVLQAQPSGGQTIYVRLSVDMVLKAGA